jgi:hypothetical protein
VSNSHPKAAPNTKIKVGPDGREFICTCPEMSEEDFTYNPYTGDDEDTWEMCDNCARAQEEWVRLNLPPIIGEHATH